MRYKTTFRQVFVVLLMAATAPLTFAQTTPLPRSVCAFTSITLPPGALYPNGIARASDGTLYVGLVTSGRILRKSPGKEWETFFEGSDTVFASTTLRLDEQRGLLWGNSPDFLPVGKSRSHRIFALDTSTATVRRNLTLPDDGMGNDIVLAPNGMVYLSETRAGSIMRLRPTDREFQVVIRDDRLAGPDGIGAAGIVRLDNNTLVVANFGTGKIYILNDVEGKPRLQQMALPRLIENPDGMGLAPDGSLIVLENAIKSGQGKVLRVADPLTPGMHRIGVVRDGMESPVNLDITAQGCALVTESRIRHRLLPGRESQVPDQFRIYGIPLVSPQG
jgi:DNA-binding beta-propeller fold protein YncE